MVVVSILPMYWCPCQHPKLPTTHNSLPYCYMIPCIKKNEFRSFWMYTSNLNVDSTHMNCSTRPTHQAIERNTVRCRGSCHSSNKVDLHVNSTSIASSTLVLKRKNKQYVNKSIYNTRRIATTIFLHFPLCIFNIYSKTTCVCCSNDPPTYASLHTLICFLRSFSDNTDP